MCLPKMFQLWVGPENIVYNLFNIPKKAIMITVKVRSSNKFNYVPYGVYGAKNASGFFVKKMTLFTFIFTKPCQSHYHELALNILLNQCLKL